MKYLKNYIAVMFNMPTTYEREGWQYREEQLNKIIKIKNQTIAVLEQKLTR